MDDLQPSHALVVIGCAAGVLLSVGMARVVSGLLYGVSPYSPRLLASSCAVLAVTALIAAWLPVQRASSVDPLTALRHE